MFYTAQPLPPCLYMHPPSHRNTIPHTMGARTPNVHTVGPSCLSCVGPLAAALHARRCRAAVPAEVGLAEEVRQEAADHRRRRRAPRLPPGAARVPSERSPHALTSARPTAGRPCMRPVSAATHRSTHSHTHLRTSALRCISDSTLWSQDWACAQAVPRLSSAAPLECAQALPTAHAPPALASRQSCRAAL